ncbi:SDR family NAD(P)-dependent oxidoreductase, partial [Mesorhizobium japonicum]|uniref:SDR family NAD(P)-dependent oxidoreductase n=1 Tax=Mesorhizobium japonicum TaxID=2066070 RepID=UPI003B5A8F3C
MTALFDLAGRRAVVTGARRGIGRAMAQALAEAGADIVAVSSQQQADDELGEVVRGYGRRFEAHAVDFADRDAVARFGEELAATAPDILVNNAGT